MLLSRIESLLQEAKRLDDDRLEKYDIINLLVATQKFLFTLAPISPDSSLSITEQDVQQCLKNMDIVLNAALQKKEKNAYFLKVLEDCRQCIDRQITLFFSDARNQKYLQSVKVKNNLERLSQTLKRPE